PKSDEEPSPLGSSLAAFEAFTEASPHGAIPFGGYYWKILDGQGEHAPGGAFSYVINGNMIAGFALVCVPAEYGNTGIMTFFVNNQGKVYQKDLGEKSLEIVKAMKVYDPDETWTLVKEAAEVKAPAPEPKPGGGDQDGK
ncbi:MAG: DUF2950 family protein, partial [Planctomycetota bacterium]